MLRLSSVHAAGRVRTELSAGIARDELTLNEGIPWQSCYPILRICLGWWGTLTCVSRRARPIHSKDVS